MLNKLKQKLDFRNWSLNARVSIALLIGTVLIGSIVSGFALPRLQDFLEEQIGETFLGQAQSLGKQLEGFFLEKVGQVQALALVNTIEDAVVERNAGYTGTNQEILDDIIALDEHWIDAPDDDPLVAATIITDKAVNPAGHQLAEFEDAFPDHTEIFFTDRYGALIATTNRTSDYYQADEAWWQAAWNDGQGAVYISDPEFDESAGVTALLIAVPIIDDDEVIGVLRTTLVIDAVFALMRGVQFGQTGHAVLFDRNGQILFDPIVEGGEIGSAGLSSDLKRQLLREGAHYIVAEDEHQDQAVFGHGQISALLEVAAVGHSANEDKDSPAPQAHMREDQTRDAVARLGWTVVIRQEGYEAFALVNQLLLFINGIGLIASVVLILLVAAIVYGVTRSLRNLVIATEQIAAGDLSVQVGLDTGDEVGHLSRQFDRMVERLREVFAAQEAQAEQRVAEFETIVAVSEQFLIVLNEDQLLADLVNRVQAQFGYYHVHIYLLDAENQNLVVRAGVGQVGAEMIAAGHHIALNAPTSLVAQAARSQRAVRVDNVREAADWLPNPLLPDTYSEMAVPIVVEGQVLGVLDVQEDEVGGLDESDANLLRLLVNQVAIALRNARLFQEFESALAEAREAQERYIEGGWRKRKAKETETSYHYAGPNVPALTEASIEATRKQAFAQSEAAVVPLNSHEAAEEAATEDVSRGVIVAPITLQNKRIGAVQIHPADAEQQWASGDLALAQAIIDQFAQTAENLRLFDETRQRAGRERTIREITERMRAATSLEELVKTTAHELGERLAAGRAVVALGLEPETHSSMSVSKRSDNGR